VAAATTGNPAIAGPLLFYVPPWHYASLCYRLQRTASARAARTCRPNLVYSQTTLHASVKPVESVDSNLAARRDYQRQWQASKRRALKVQRVESITLEIPLAMAKKLRARKPYGWGFKQFLIRLLAESNRSPVEDTPRPLPASEPVRVVAVPGRNDLCPCGSGLKFKRCCGGAVPPCASDRAS